MNSKQRRSIVRKFKYKITLQFIPGHYDPVFDDNVDKAETWCKKKCAGLYKIDSESYFEKVIFSFEKERDAIFFALKWL
jgi:hypothetical protein